MGNFKKGLATRALGFAMLAVLSGAAQAGPLDAISVITAPITIDVKVRDVTSSAGPSGQISATGLGSASVGNSAPLTAVGSVVQMGSAYLSGKVTIRAEARDVVNNGGTVAVGSVVQGARQR